MNVNLGEQSASLWLSTEEKCGFNLIYLFLILHADCLKIKFNRNHSWLLSEPLESTLSLQTINGSSVCKDSGESSPASSFLWSNFPQLPVALNGSEALSLSH